MSDTGKQDDIKAPTRRRLLQMGAIGATAVVTVRPAFATTVQSVLNCGINVPDGADAGKYVAMDGTPVDPGTPGAYPGGIRYQAADIEKGMRGWTMPGGSWDQGQAHINYIKRLRPGQTGFSCYASIQNHNWG